MLSRTLIVLVLSLVLTACGGRSTWQDDADRHIVRRGETLYSIAWRYGFDGSAATGDEFTIQARRLDGDGAPLSLHERGRLSLRGACLPDPESCRAAALSCRLWTRTESSSRSTFPWSATNGTSWAGGVGRSGHTGSEQVDRLPARFQNGALSGRIRLARRQVPLPAGLGELALSQHRTAWACRGHSGVSRPLGCYRGRR